MSQPFAEPCPKQIEVVLNFAPDYLSVEEWALNATEYARCCLSSGHRGPCRDAAFEEIASPRASAES